MRQCAARSFRFNDSPARTPEPCLPLPASLLFQLSSAHRRRLLNVNQPFFYFVVHFCRGSIWLDLKLHQCSSSDIVQCQLRIQCPSLSCFPQDGPSKSILPRLWHGTGSMYVFLATRNNGPPIYTSSQNLEHINNITHLTLTALPLHLQ